MPIFALQLKCNLVGVTDLQPADFSDYRWHMKLKCSMCGELSDRWQYAALQEEQELTKGKGVCHLYPKCSLCGRKNSLAILPESKHGYMVDKNEEFQTVLEFDCRGLEPVEFEPRGLWKCVGIESNTEFNEVDLNEKVWAEYDEKAGAAVEINELSSRFLVKR